MITYIIIGVIAQLIIFTERSIRFPEVWTKGVYKHWLFWVTLILGGTVNALVWPLSIVCEIIWIIYGI